MASNCLINSSGVGSGLKKQKASTSFRLTQKCSSQLLKDCFLQ